MPRHASLSCLLVAGALALAAAPASPPAAPTASGPHDPASSAGEPLDPDQSALTTVFTPPPTSLPDGTLRHTPDNRPEWARAFDPGADPEWEFQPAPAPDLFVAEPDYGDVDAGMVHAASALLGRATPWELEEDAARELLAEAADEAAVLTTLTGTRFDRQGLLRASARLGQPADDLWDLDVGLLAGAASSSLERTLATWGVHVDDGAPVGAVTDALRTAQRRAGLPTRVGAANLARLSTRSTVARSDGTTRRGVRVDLGDAEAVAGLLRRHDVTATLPDGTTARGHLLVWHPDDPDLELTTDLAAGWGARATVRDASARLGAVAAVNGGFWLDDGEPDGLLVTDGRMRSDATAWTGTRRGVRGAVGVTGDRVVVDRPDWQVHLRGDGRTVGVDALNRPARPGQTVAWNGDGPLPSGTAAGWWHVPDVGGAGPAVRLPGPVPPGPGQLLVATHHDLAGTWRTVVTASEGWEGLDDALAGGPRLVYDGSPTPEGWWLGEGFAAAHTHRRHPRTAVGVDAYGGLLVLVLDGRQPGWSAGATQAETQSVLLALGAEDATMLDGGGSSQLVVGGAVRNRPCCDQPTRAVATVAAFVPRR